MAQLVWNNADPFALEVGKTQQALLALPLTAPQALGIASTIGRHTRGERVLSFELIAIKNAVLGVNGALLATWIGQAALAYTDAPGAAAHYDFVANRFNVVPSKQFTPVAGPVPATALGAIYEFREHEIPMANGNTAAVIAALTALLNAA